jgi:hypothetical protein
MNKLVFLLILLLITCVLGAYVLHKRNTKIREQFQTQSLYTAVIIEPRVHEAFEMVLENFLTRLDRRWDFIIFHGNLNKDLLENLIDTKFSEHKSRIKLIKMNIDNLTLYDYSRLFRCKRFYDYIPTEMFLIFQLDTLISDVYYDKIYDFMDYDYVGAPWAEHMIPHVKNRVGNGGLSLRRKSKMLEVIQNTTCPIDTLEDQIFALYDNLNRPSIDEAMHFSVESIYYDQSFGIHKSWWYLSETQMQEISQHIPGIYKLRDLYESHKNQPAQNVECEDIGCIFDI